MPVSRRAFLATQGAALGALFVPGSLLAAVEAATPKPPKLDDWSQVRKQFRLSPSYLHFAGFFISSHPAPVRDAIDAYRKAIDENPFAVVDGGLFEDESKNVQSRVRRPGPRTSAGSRRRWRSPRTPPPGSRSSTTASSSSPARKSSPPTTITGPTTRPSASRACAAAPRSGRSPSSRKRRGQRPRTSFPGSSPPSAPRPGWWGSPGCIRSPGSACRSARSPTRSRGSTPSASQRTDRIGGRRRARPRLHRRDRRRDGRRLLLRRHPQVDVRPAGHRAGVGEARRLGAPRPTIPTFSDEEVYEAWKEDRPARTPTMRGA